MEAAEITDWLKMLEVALLASVKFLIAPFEAERYHFSFMKAFGVTTGGGIIGILVFAFVGHGIARWWRHVTAMIKSIFVRRSPQAIERKPRKKFTRKNRFLVGIKRRFGLFGIAFVTPCIISIPIGTLVAISFFRNKKKVLAYLLISLVLWSVVLNLLAQYLNLSQYLPHHQ